MITFSLIFTIAYGRLSDRAKIFQKLSTKFLVPKVVNQKSKIYGCFLNFMCELGFSSLVLRVVRMCQVFKNGHFSPVFLGEICMPKKGIDFYFQSYDMSFILVLPRENCHLLQVY